MSQVIIDMGSGNTCKNRYADVRRMIDELAAVDTGKHEIVIKWQLFLEAGENEFLHRSVFAFAYRWAARKGYKTTASVFDLDSLSFLLEFFDVPFIKIANNRKLDWLISEIPRKIPVYVSKNGSTPFHPNLVPQSYYDGDYSTGGIRFKVLHCISRYPASIEDYENSDYDNLYDGISDHTTDFTLWHKYKPDVYEVHFKLSDSTGLDAGDFARTPEQLKEIL